MGDIAKRLSRADEYHPMRWYYRMCRDAKREIERLSRQLANREEEVRLLQENRTHVFEIACVLKKQRDALLACRRGEQRYVDSSGYGNHGTLTNMDAASDWVWIPELGRWLNQAAKAAGGEA